MSRLSIEQLVTTPSTLNYLSESAYDYTKWNLGKGLIYNAGATAVDKYIAPHFSVLRPMEESTAFAAAQISAYNLSTTYAYVFGVENSVGATATRRVHLWTVNRKTGAFSWNGFITMTLGSATAHTVRDFKIDVKNESTGTVAVSATAVTGTTTLFATNKVAVGARIGFGSTVPSAITTWYRISVRTSDTALTLATSAGTIGAGTAYVIQEFRPIYVATNATTTNGGVHYGKGITPEDFTSGGTTIALAAATDDVKAIYWLKDAAVVTNLVAAGAAADFAAATPTSLNLYVVDLVVAGSYKFFQYNIRAALTVVAGVSTSAFVLATGNNVFTGTGSQNMNLCIATAAHGTGSGIKSLYLVTTTRIYRVPVTQITTTSTTVFSSPSDNIAEIPTGGTSTFALTSILSTVEYMPSIDAFIIGTTHATGTFSYVSQYVASGQQLQRQFGRDYKYLEQSLKDSGHPSLFSNQITICNYTDAGGNRIFVCKVGTTISTNAVYIIAFGADWDYAVASSGSLISPEITTPNAQKYYRAFANRISYVGSSALGKGTEPFKLWVRTANIQSDATTGWTLVDEANDLSGFAGAASIQFCIEFKTIGESCLPARILGINLAYEDNATTDSHYEGSVSETVLASRIFGWRQKTAWGSNIPRLRIRIINVATSSIVLDDDTTTAASGTFEYSTDGVVWLAWDNTKDVVGYYIRYTATALPDGISVRALLTLY